MTDQDPWADRADAMLGAGQLVLCDREGGAGIGSSRVVAPRASHGATNAVAASNTASSRATMGVMV